MFEYLKIGITFVYLEDSSAAMSTAVCTEIDGSENFGYLW